MFPTGPAGVALFILRVSVAATLFIDGTAHETVVASFWAPLVYAPLAILLCLGFMTPYCSSVCCLIELSILIMTRGQNNFHLIIAMLNSGVLAVMGPGAYSIDALLFGRRLLSLPPSKKSDASDSDDFS